MRAAYAFAVSPFVSAKTTRVVPGPVVRKVTRTPPFASVRSDRCCTTIGSYARATHQTPPSIDGRGSVTESGLSTITFNVTFVPGGSFPTGGAEARAVEAAAVPSAGASRTVSTCRFRENRFVTAAILPDSLLAGCKAAAAIIRPAMESARIDKWLWAARFFKTRGAATEAVLGGRVQVNGQSVKPAKDIHVDDTVEVRVGPQRWTIVVTGIADKRGPAAVAATLYEETQESAETRERLARERRLSRPLGADLGARPTKQARRRIEAL